MNHSFEPSCKIDNGYITAIRDIDIGDEITFNYNSSERHQCHVHLWIVKQIKWLMGKY